MSAAEDIVVSSTLVIPEAELTYTASRSGGAGGQHVNKTSSRVDMRWNIVTSEVLSPSQRALLLRRLGNRLNNAGELIVVVDTERSQHRNLAIAKERLGVLVLNALKVQKRRVATKPTLGSKQRRLTGKRVRSLHKSNRRVSMDE